MCNQHTKLYLLGNKTDLTNMREVTKLQARTYAEENTMLFGECSALDGEGIETNLQKMMSEIYETMMKEDVLVDNPLLYS